MDEINQDSKFEHCLGLAEPNNPMEQDEDDIQISLAPYIQTYLAQTGQRVSCCGIGLPVPFERAARRSWWDPRFDSEILEGQFRTSSFPQVQLRFQYALIYIMVLSLVWIIYFVTFGLQGTAYHWGSISLTFAFLFFTILTFLVFTYTDVYRRFTLHISFTVTLLISLLSLIFIIVNPSNNGEADISPMGQFSIAIEILLVMYTVIPLPLYVSVVVGTCYSILFECLTLNLTDVELYTTNKYNTLVRAFSHVCVHLIGLHILIMTNVRMRGTFMKVGQSLLVRRQLEMEKLLKEKMILSVMPPKVATWLLNEGGGQEYEDTIRGNDIRSLFRPFNMVRMDDVSILFADIVGFTRMSSKKSAEELVGILNDLFERFDDLCVSNNCEKISTLGDCYYCVSGCPEPNPEHAKCCVEMGLGMINAIQQFDAERNEGVNMRVGVHTGTVQCGIVGTKRFKFDVWSNDVTLANQMESSGIPGRVHLSEKTRQFLGDTYRLEDGEVVQGIRTYFVIGRKSESSLLALEKLPKVFNAKTDDSLKVTIPQLCATLAPSRPRPRVASCSQSQKTRRHHYLQLLANTNNQVKASSLPSILDSDNETDEESCDKMEEELNKSPLSSASCGKFSSRSPTIWRYPKSFTRRSEETMPLGVKLIVPTVVKKSDSNIEVPSSTSDEDQLSVSPSINSRKDSGIRSTSRRSSIQQQIFVMNGLTQGELHHRVSGYYTSSQSSFDDLENADPNIRRSHLPPPLGENFGTCFQKLRKQSDLQLIRCVQDNVTSHRSYFVKPPLSDISLFFRQNEMEREYRANAHRVNEKHGTSPPTLATSRFNTYFDVLISALVYMAVSTSLFLIYEATVTWISMYILAVSIETFAVMLCICQLLGVKNKAHATKDFTRKILDRFSTWYPWHLCGAVLVSLPILSVLISFSCVRAVAQFANFYYSYLLFVGLVHFCNFTQLNCWMKSIMASIAGILYLILVTSQACKQGPILDTSFVSAAINNSDLNIGQQILVTSISISDPDYLNVDVGETTLGRILRQMSNSDSYGKDVIHSLVNTTSTVNGNFSSNSTNGRLNDISTYKAEIFVDIILLLILVWFLNREFEISYRLSFHSNFVAARDKSRVQSMKNQADWLLHNIIPKHVADQLKNTAKYSENHADVGVIFASIVNFNELYDESYLGGKEYLRVLNELIGDFDELLTKPEFKNVEKIKTIGSTFMAASGLNPGVRRQSQYPNQHLFELMDFAMALQKVIDDFNRDLLEFTLVLRIGFNFGDVTAGVIGTTKLYYDIWGDAVNIASRMDSTGVCGRIQVGVACLPILSERYEFEPRGSVYVKGKDNMNVFLLKGKLDLNQAQQ